MDQDRGSKNRPRGMWAPQVPLDPARWPFFYGWMILIVGTIGIVFSIPGQTMGFSVFTDILMRELGLTRVQLSAAYCAGTVLSGLALPWLGKVFDQFGARKMVVGSSVATGMVLVYLSQTRQVIDGALFVLPKAVPAVAVSFMVICVGFFLIRASAQGVLTLTSRNVMGKWFDYHRGLVMAISGVVTAFTFSVAPRFLDSLIQRFDWHGAWLTLGVLTSTVMVTLGWLFFRDNPEECGLKMDGNLPENRKKKAHADSVAHRDYSRHEALRTWAFWAFNLTFVFVAYSHTASTFHIESLGKEAGRLRSEVIGYFLPIAFVSVATSLASGWFSPRTRLKYHLKTMNLACVLGLLGLIHLQTSWGVVAYVVGNGMCGGFFVSLSGIVWPRFYGRLHLGAISGVGMASMVIASGVGPLLYSLSHRYAGSYSPILWVSALIPAALFIGSGWADNPQRRDGAANGKGLET